MVLESQQVYSDRGPYLNPSDHPCERWDDEDKIIEEDDISDMGRESFKEPSYMDQAWAVARIVIWMGVLALAVLFLASTAKADETAILTIAYEASSQPIEGQIAVASVIKTRMKKTGKSAREVVLKPYQFSCWDPKTHQPAQRRALKQSEIDRAREAWTAAQPDIYDHYCRHDCRPYWIKSAKQSKRIKDHTFYQL